MKLLLTICSLLYCYNVFPIPEEEGHHHVQCNNGTLPPTIDQALDMFKVYQPSLWNTTNDRMIFTTSSPIYKTKNNDKFVALLFMNVRTISLTHPDVLKDIQPTHLICVLPAAALTQYTTIIFIAIWLAVILVGVTIVGVICCAINASRKS